MTRKGTRVWEYKTTEERLLALLGERKAGFIHGVRHSQLYISGKESNCYIQRFSDGTIEVILYKTVIVRYTPDGSVWLNNGGYATMCTHRWINQLVPNVRANRVNYATVFTPLEGYEFRPDSEALFRTTGTLRREGVV